MAQLVTVTNRGLVNGRGQVTVEASVAGNVVTQIFAVDSVDTSLESLKTAVRDWLTALTASANLVSAIPLGSVDVTAATPTPAEAARAAYRDDCILMRRYAKAINAGVLLSSNQAVVDLKARLLANYLPAYVDLLEILP